jgi:hypothetical protein
MLNYESSALNRDHGGTVIAGRVRMVIDAARIFRCAHTYVAVKEGRRVLLVCASCAHRTESLPLRKPVRHSAQPAERVDIRPSRARVRFNRIGRG